MHSMRLISFCTKSGDAELCPAAEDDSLSSSMEISGSILFSNAAMCALLPSVDAPPHGPILPSCWTDCLLHTRDRVVGNALPVPSGVAPPE